MAITIDGDEVTGVTIDGDDVSEITMDGDVVWTAEEIVDNFSHNALTSYYQGSTGDYTITSSWSDSGGYSLESTNDQAGFIRSYPQGNEYCNHSSSFDIYPTEGDTAWVVTRAQESSDGGFNGAASTLTMAINSGSTSERVEITHQRPLEGSALEITDAVGSGSQSTNTNASISSGDIVSYELDWSSGSLTAGVYVEESFVDDVSMSIGGELPDTGIAWRVRPGTGASTQIDRMYIG